MTMKGVSIGLLLVLHSSDAFVVQPPAIRNAQHGVVLGRPLNMVDPLSTVNMLTTTPDLWIAAASAGAGALSQVPRINDLKRELKISQENLEKSQEELVSKIAELEEKLFVMDEEYERQTDKFKKDYDTRMKDQIERTKEKLKSDFQFNLEIKVQEEKSKMLMEQLEAVGGLLVVGSKKEVGELRLQQEQLEEANKVLEDALVNSEEEFLRLKEEVAVAQEKKKGFVWPWEQ